MKNNLTRKQFYQNEQERGGHLDQPGVHFVSIPSDSEQRELSSKPTVDFKTVQDLGFYALPYEIELQNYNRMIGNGIHNMNEINQNLINMKQRGDTFEITGFTCTIGTSSIEVTFSGDNKKDDIRLYVGFYAILSDTNGQQMSFKISSTSLTEISISEIQTDATFNSSDSSYTVSINKDNLFIPLIAVASGSIAAGDNKMDYTSDNAFIEFGVDLTSYHGNHKIVVTDSAGKSASAYLHSVAPGGETLGGTYAVNGDFAVDEPPGTAWIRTAGWTVAEGVATAVTATHIYQSISAISAGEVLKVQCDLKTRTAGSIGFNFLGQTLGSYTVPADGIFLYRVATLGIGNFGMHGTEFSGSIDNYSLQSLTDCAATGSLIVSTLGGSTRSWTSVDAGFNPNLECDYTIWEAR